MILLLDNEGKVNFDEITGNTTVQELLDAIDVFLGKNKLPCDKCHESCCKKHWSVGIDNVFIKRLCGFDNEAAAKFIKEKLTLKENICKEFDQYVLKKETDCFYIDSSNLCTIYEQRPLICRLYICTEVSNRYNMLRELVAAAFLKALVTEVNAQNENIDLNEKDRRNPAVLASDYNVFLKDLIEYAVGEEWLEPADLN